MLSVPTLDTIDVAGKRVLVRADLNVPMKDGVVTDTTRIDRFAPTAKMLADKGAKVIICIHFGRPKGQVVPEMSVKPLVAPLAAAVGKDVAFAEDCIGEKAEAVVNALPEGGIALLENLRFHKEEEKNDEGFAAQLARLADVYVNDAFSCAHRAHASTHGVAKLLPSAAGPSMQAELEALAKAVDVPQKPVAALVGGSKVSTKLDVLNHLINKVDKLIIGGGMANTFLFAQGYEIGTSLCEKDMIDTAKQILEAAKSSSCQILLPRDVVVASAFEANAMHETVMVDHVPAQRMILDIGPLAIGDLDEALNECKTLLWNGPLGVFEMPPFDNGTVAVAREAANLTRQGKLVTVAGGGDTVAALNHAGVAEDFSYISTAGGAFLEYIEGKELPGVAILSQKG